MAEEKKEVEEKPKEKRVGEKWLRIAKKRALEIEALEKGAEKAEAKTEH
jgi:hypothetical protein